MCGTAVALTAVGKEASLRREGGNLRKGLVALLAVFALVLVMNRTARADSYGWTITSGTNTSGGAVSAVMTVTTTSGGIDIQVVNTEDNPSNIAQIITGLKFALTSAGLADGLGAPGIQSQDGILRTIVTCSSSGPGCGTYTDSSYGNFSPPVSAGWDTNASTNYYKGGLAICAGGCGTWSPDGIIGDADPTTGLYDNYPTSSLGNGTHPPEVFGSIDQPVTFHLYAAGVTANTTVASLITGASFVFGTSGEVVTAVQGPTIPPPPPPIPEPSTLALFLPGAAGLVMKLRRKLR